MKRTHAMLSGISAIATIIGAAPATAQSVDSASADAGPNASQADPQAERGQLGDIIVTARRKQESAQTVPVAVSVASAEALENHQVLNAYQLVNLTPSLQTRSTNQQAGAVNFTIRGIGTSVFGPQIEQSVGIVIDDVVMSRPQFGNVQYFDLDRIEVLRGPQGMLFGKNASAGLINIVTAQPKLNRTEVVGNALYGNTTAPGSGNLATFQAAVNVPLGGNAAIRASAFVTRQDAFVKDIALDQNLGNTAYGGRVKLLWEPTDSIRLTLAGDYQRAVGPGEGVLVRRFTAPGGLINTVDSANGITASPTNVLLATNIRNENRTRVYGGSFKLEWDLGGGYTLTNVFAHRRADTYTSIDTDTTTANLFDVNRGELPRRQTTEELRLSSPSDKPFSYQLGFFYLDLFAREFLLQGADLGLPPFVPGLSNFGGRGDSWSPTKSYAGFFEGQYKLTDDLRITAGGRYTHDDIRFTTIGTNPAAVIALAPARSISRRRQNDNFSYRIGLDYNVTPDVLVYGTFTRGYKGPTFDQRSAADVDPEIPTSYEIGLKSTVLDRRLRLNVALFDTTFKGFQTQAQAPGTATGFFTLNAGELKSRGVELEFTALPAEGLTISGGTTYNFTEYRNLNGVPCYPGQPKGTSGTNVCLPNGTTDVSGNQLDNAPRWTTTITARYEAPISSSWIGFVQGDVYHRSSFQFTQTRDPNLRVGPAAIAGLSVGAKTADDKVSFSLFVRNLFDKRVPSYIFNDPVGGAYVGPKGVSDDALGGDYWQSFGPNSFRTIGASLNFKM